MIKKRESYRMEQRIQQLEAENAQLLAEVSTLKNTQHPYFTLGNKIHLKRVSLPTDAMKYQNCGFINTGITFEGSLFLESPLPGKIISVLPSYSIPIGSFAANNDLCAELGLPEEENFSVFTIVLQPPSHTAITLSTQSSDTSVFLSLLQNTVATNGRIIKTLLDENTIASATITSSSTLLTNTEESSISNPGLVTSLTQISFTS